MKTCIATGQKADGTHLCLYVGPDAAAAIKCATEPDPKLRCVATAAYVRPIPTKARKFDQPAKVIAPAKPKPAKADEAQEKSETKKAKTS